MAQWKPGVFRRETYVRILSEVKDRAVDLVWVGVYFVFDRGSSGLLKPGNASVVAHSRAGKIGRGLIVSKIGIPCNGVFEVLATASAASTSLEFRSRPRHLTVSDMPSLSEDASTSMDACASVEAVGQARPMQVRRLLERIDTGGAASIRHKAIGRPSNNRISDGVRDYAVTLVRERYVDFGPTLAAEKLAERDGVRVLRETVGRWMTDAGLWLSRKQRRTFHQPRLRRGAYGELGEP